MHIPSESTIYFSLTLSYEVKSSLLLIPSLIYLVLSKNLLYSHAFIHRSRKLNLEGETFDQKSLQLRIDPGSTSLPSRHSRDKLSPSSDVSLILEKLARFHLLLPSVKQTIVLFLNYLFQKFPVFRFLDNLPQIFHWLFLVLLTLIFATILLRMHVLESIITLFYNQNDRYA